MLGVVVMFSCVLSRSERGTGDFKASESHLLFIFLFR